jgi:hypothetical protein
MSFFRHVVREYLIHRLSGGRRHAYGHRRRYPRHRSHRRHRQTYPVILRRPQQRTRVHVGGCCLPIPLTMLLGSMVLVQLVIRRVRR